MLRGLLGGLAGGALRVSLPEPSVLMECAGSESAEHQRHVGSESDQRRYRSEEEYLPRDLEHHSVQEHATRLIWWIQQNIDLSAGLVFHDAILEYYVEMIIEAGWQERSWNPIARQLDLICTGGKKPYEWVYTKTGQKRRRRIYPIPPIVSGHSTTRTSVWRAA